MAIEGAGAPIYAQQDHDGVTEMGQASIGACVVGLGGSLEADKADHEGN